MPLSSHAWSERLSERFYVKLLLLLLFTDVAFMALHLLHVSGLLLNEELRRQRGPRLRGDLPVHQNSCGALRCSRAWPCGNDR